MSTGASVEVSYLEDGTDVAEKGRDQPLNLLPANTSLICRRTLPMDFLFRESDGRVSGLAALVG